MNNWKIAIIYKKSSSARTKGKNISMNVQGRRILID